MCRSSLFCTTLEVAEEAWSAVKLDRITLQECRHTFASLMIAAGVDTSSLQEFIGPNVAGA